MFFMEFLDNSQNQVKLKFYSVTNVPKFLQQNMYRIIVTIKKSGRLICPEHN